MSEKNYRYLNIERKIVDDEHCVQVYISDSLKPDDMSARIVCTYDELVDAVEEMSNFKRFDGCIGIAEKVEK